MSPSLVFWVRQLIGNTSQTLISFVLSVGLRISWLHCLQRDKSYECSVYDTKLHLVVRLESWNSEVFGVSLHCHYTQDPGSLWSRMVVPVKVISMAQIDLCKNYLYCIGMLETIQLCEKYLYLEHLISCHHHPVMPPAWISLTPSRHSSLSFIAFGRSSGLHPISSQSCYM